MLLIQLVSICILHGIHCMRWRHVLQEDVPAMQEYKSMFIGDYVEESYHKKIPHNTDELGIQYATSTK